MNDERCSFCGRSRGEVVHLLRGTNAFICDRCVLACMREMQERKQKLPGPVEELGVGQILVRFPDGSAHVCEQESGWMPFRYEGEALQWCAAWGSAGGPKRLSVLAVRRGGTRGPVVGATFDTERLFTDDDVRMVIDAAGGVARFRTLEASAASREHRDETREKKKDALLPFMPSAAFDVTSFLSQQYRVPTVNLDEYEVAAEVLALVPAALCRKLTVLPVSHAGSSIIVAMVDASDTAAIDELKTTTGYNVEPVLASASVIKAAIARYYDPKDGKSE